MARTPSGMQVAIATAFAASLSFSAITNAAEAVATVTGSTIANGEFLEVTSGWGRLNGRIVRAKAASATSITFEGFDTSNTVLFPAGSGVGSVRKINTWVAVPNFSNLAQAGGEDKTVTVQFVDTEDEQTVRDGRSATSYSLDIDADNRGNAAWNALKSISDGDTTTALRMTTKSGALTLLSCTASLNEASTMSSGQVMMNKVVFYGRGRVTTYAS